MEGEGRYEGAEVGGIAEDSEGDENDAREGGEGDAAEESNNVSPEVHEGNSPG